MKKTLSILLALTLVLGMGITVFAADMTVTGGSEHAVTGKYVAGAESGTTYGVDISWGDMVFTYTDASKGTWNAAEHKYENGTAAKWTCAEGQNVITVTNHSNAPIDVTPSYTAETAYSTAEVKFDKTTLNLGTADNGEGDNGAGKATNGSITVTVSGTLAKDDKTSAANGTTIGQITLTIKDASVTVTAITADKATYTYMPSGSTKETLEDVTFTVTYSDKSTASLKYGDEGLTVTADGAEFSTTTSGSYAYTATYADKTCSFTMVCDEDGLEAPSIGE